MLQQELLKLGIGFNKDNEFKPFPIDNENPLMDASRYGLSRKVLGNTFHAWKQWRKFACHMLGSAKGIDFFKKFLAHGTTDIWNDYERSEIAHHTKECHFGEAHVTRIDFAMNQSGKLMVLDPNVMPYGIAPLIASQELLGVKDHVSYLEKLSRSNSTWVTDKYHGSASSMQWLCNFAGIRFSYSDEFESDENVIRLSRRAVRGTVSTISPPGIRAYESQLWSALINIPNLTDSFGFKIDAVLHRSHCTPCYLGKISEGKILIATDFKNGNVGWVNFQSFQCSQWSGDFATVFLKCLFTSGCHQVTFSDFKEAKISKILQSKLGIQEGFFLLQPALPCTVNNERVRVASYVGPNGEHYGSEVTRVSPTCMLSHGGEHAKLSYLQL